MKRLTLALMTLALPVVALSAVSVGDGSEVTCGTTATKASDASVGDKVQRWAVLCLPEDAANSVRVGGPGVTVSTGTELLPGKCYAPPEPLAKGVSLYCIAATNTDATIQEFPSSAR